MKKQIENLRGLGIPVEKSAWLDYNVIAAPHWAGKNR
jgi:hypothetical protein